VTDLHTIRTTLERRKGERDALSKEFTTAQSDLKQWRQRKIDVEEGQLIIQTVALATQQRLEQGVSELVTDAIDSIYPGSYRFELRFRPQRAKSEASLQLVSLQSNESVDVLDASGGGVGDVVAFALRVGLWKMKHSSRPTLILDEPFRFVSPDLQPLVGMLLSKLSHTLHIQIIMVTREQSLAEVADRTFVVKQSVRRKGTKSWKVSEVQEL
jgi:DNA repair exonuclease SbcCD ATPase subunit